MLTDGLDIDLVRKDILSVGGVVGSAPLKRCEDALCFVKAGGHHDPRLLRPTDGAYTLCARHLNTNGRMGSATALVFVLVAGGGLGVARACHPGLKCHFGADYEAIGNWAATQVCPGCTDVNNCTTSQCVPHNRHLNCSHPVCFHRRTQLLLQHPPVECSPGFEAMWKALHRQCATVNGECCNQRECPHPTTRHCGLQFKAADQYAASLYIGVATLAAAMALLRDDTTTVLTVTSRTRYQF